MHDREDFNFLKILTNPIDDDVGIFDQLERAGHDARAAHPGKGIQLEQANPVTDARDQLPCSRRVILFDPFQDVREIAFRLSADNDLYTP